MKQAIRERIEEWANPPAEGDPMIDVLLDDLQDAGREIDRLQAIIDSRPAINAALPQSYIDWSQGIYATEILDAIDRAGSGGGRQ